MNTQYENIIPTDENLKISCQKSNNIKPLLEYMHIHDEAEFLYMSQGSVSVILNDTAQTVESGNVLIINRLIPHYFYDLTDDAEYILFHFKPHVAYDNKKISIKYLEPFYHTKSFTYHLATNNHNYTVNIADCLKEIYANLKEEFAYELIIQSLLIKLLYLLNTNNIFTTATRESNVKAKAIKRIASLQKYIYNHYAEELTVTFACEFSQLDYHYFSKFFKQETGKTFVEYVNMVRLNQAQKMLTQTTLTVHYIAQSVGIPNVTYFNRLFKQHCGKTPKEYREANKLKPL